MAGLVWSVLRTIVQTNLGKTLCGTSLKQITLPHGVRDAAPLHLPAPLLVCVCVCVCVCPAHVLPLS